MEVNNISNITEGSLVAVSNQTPFALMVESNQKPKVFLKVEYEQGGTIADGCEMLEYASAGTQYYFIMDLRDIIGSVFDSGSIDDDLQPEWSWKNMRDMLQDIKITYTVESVEELEALTGEISFTVINSSVQVNNGNRIAESPEVLANLDQNETIWAGVHNIGYAYAIVPFDSDISVSEEEKEYFIDSDDYYFTDNNELLFEI